MSSLSIMPYPHWPAAAIRARQLAWLRKTGLALIMRAAKLWRLIASMSAQRSSLSRSCAA